MNKPLNSKSLSNFKEIPLEYRDAPVSGVDEENRTVEVVWTTGAAVKRFDWLSGEYYIEELEVKDGSIRLDRLNSGGPVLDNHKAYGSVGDMLAVVERAWIEKGEGRAVVRFPKAEDDLEADRIFKKIKDKIITRLSCGYRRIKINVDKNKTPKVWRVIDWEPFEISFVTIPADVNAKVRGEEAPSFRCEFLQDGKPQNRLDQVRSSLARKRA